jgi:cell fate (sporulation/competence/biofilm development) regulator YlbF (YheA/YmcA/DUF963 family)
MSNQINKDMNVEQLISELSKIEDKTQEVVLIGHNDDDDVVSIRQENNEVQLLNC